MTTAANNSVFLGHSDSAAAIRRYDWASNPLGPIDQWSHSLRTTTGVILNSGFPHCIVWGPERITLHNDAFVPILGQKTALGRPFDHVWREAWDFLAPMVERAYAGEATFIEDYPLVVDRSGFAEQAYFTFCYSPVRDDDGHVAGMVDTVIETTSKVCAEKHALLVNAELAHRIQNTLTIVAAIVDQTFRSGLSVDQARAVLIHRISALGHAHDVLTQSSWSSAPMDAVIDNALAPHRHAAGQIDSQGPPLSLSASQALTLAMAIHELCTNATKYGALSVPHGKVSVRWHITMIDAEDCLHLTWTESGGPAVAQPDRRGFGSHLIEEALGEDFRGQVKMSYEPQGLRVELTTRVRNLGAGA